MANERHPLSFYFQYFRRIIIVSKVKSQHLKDVLTGTCKKGKEYGNVLTPKSWTKNISERI